MRTASFLAGAALAATSVSAHGNITWPPARLPGPAMLAACGQDAVNTVLGDGTIALEEVKPASNQCNVGLCRGAQFQDNAQNVQTFSLGQVVIVEVALTIPHEGPANVSIVQTSTNSIVGGILLFFDTYADEKLAQLPANNTAFGVTFPTGDAGREVANACRQPGDCVLQWWWLGTDAKQTYESCIDFVLSPSGENDVLSGPGGPNADAIERQNLRNGNRDGGNRQQQVVTPGAGAGAGAGAAGISSSSAAVTPENDAQDFSAAVVLPSSSSSSADTSAPAEGSFGGVQGTVSNSGSGDASGVVEDGTVVGEGSFGGVVGTAPIVARRRSSRVFRGLEM